MNGSQAPPYDPNCNAPPTNQSSRTFGSKDFISPAMPTVPRHLITTSDQRTWRRDCPAIFLGEWCKLYSEKNTWRIMDFIVAPPYGLDQSEKDKSEAQIRQTEARLFPLLVAVLNEHHGIDRSNRFWKILLGHWMRTYMSTVFNRFKSVDLCLNTHKATSTTTVVDDSYALATSDSLSSLFASNDDTWNQALYTRIISRLGKGEVTIEVLPLNREKRFRRPHVVDTSAKPRRLQKFIRRSLSKACSLLQRDEDAFIINSYLPFAHEIKLQLALGQVPQLRSTNYPETDIDVDQNLRQRLGRKFPQNPDDPLVDTLYSLVMELLPVCYLEGFQELKQQTSLLPWPKRPRFIFTSNNFDTDEVFKLWMGLQVEAGTPYYTGQHGGNYGTRRIPLRTVEEETADKFVTWGWADGLSQQKPGYLLKTAGRQCAKEKQNPRGGLLLIQECMNHRIPAWDDTAAFSVRWSDQMRFIDKLQPQVRAALSIRLHPSFKNFQWSDRERLLDFDTAISVDPGSTPIEKAIAKNRLLVFSYESSGIQEALSQNIPVIAFWRDGLDSLRNSAKPHFRTLIDVGLFHLSADSAANTVNSVFDNVGHWWNSPAIQRARVEFCGHYARTTKSPITDLKRILIS